MSEGRVVVAERFVVKDATGCIRAQLGVVDDSALFYLTDEFGNQRAGVAVTMTGDVQVLIQHANGRPAASIGVDQKGRASVKVFGDDGDERIFMAEVPPDADPCIALAGREGVSMWPPGGTE